MDFDNHTHCIDNLHSRHEHWGRRDHIGHGNQLSTDSQRNSRPKNKISQRRQADITHQCRRHARTEPTATNSVSGISHRRVSEAYTSSKVAKVHFVRMLRTRRVTLVTPLGSAGMARTKKRYKDGERSEEEVILIKGRHSALVRGKTGEAQLQCTSSAVERSRRREVEEVNAAAKLTARSRRKCQASQEDKTSENEERMDTRSTDMTMGA